MIKKFIVASAVVAASVGSVNTAVAGGLSQEIVEAPVVIPVAPVLTNRFAGGYVGLGYGHVVSSDDRVGMVDQTTNLLTGVLGDLDLEGGAAILQAGYRWANGNLVYGPTLRVRGGGIDAELTGTSTGSSTVNWEAALRGNLGYTVTPSLLLYGFVGYTYAEVEYDVAGAINVAETVNFGGVNAGLGAEYALNDNWSLFGEYEYAGYKGKNLVDPAINQHTRPTPDFHSVNIGVNFSF
ncbi:outer membrane protein [Ketogulonicigenium vulgare]|uniref:outer membrane protein n=1 Tax=Ketogulonicigenium vulgare TaxID=92945 RepID=UPI00235981FF|nr:porin family protein [Ketogulonicigenium vulgare]